MKLSSEEILPKKPLREGLLLNLCCAKLLIGHVQLIFSPVTLLVNFTTENTYQAKDIITSNITISFKCMSLTFIRCKFIFLSQIIKVKMETSAIQNIGVIMCYEQRINRTCNTQ